MNMQHSTRKILLAAAVAALTSANVYAGTVSQSPLFLSTAAESNIILGIDDSGSMDFEVLAPTNDGAFWWQQDNQSFTGLDLNDTAASSDTFNFNKVGSASDPWNKYVYLFPFPGVHIRNSGFNSSTANAHFFLPPIPTFAWARSPDYNKAYFNPAVTYDPWENSDGSSMGNITPTAAPDDPYLYPSTTIDLTSDMLDTTHGFMLFSGMSLPVGAKVWNPNGNSGSGSVDTINGLPDPIPDTNFENSTYFVATSGAVSRQYLPMQYFPATFWVRADTAADAITAAGSGFSSFVAANLLSGGEGPAGASEPLFGFEIKPANFTDSTQYSAAIQNFANWFSYYRKRHLALRASLTQTFASLSNTRVGCEYMNENTTNGCTKPGGTVSMYDLSNSSDKASFFTNFLNNSGGGGTPTWDLLNHIGLQYQRTDSGAPITQACQKNFSLIFTDGYANYPYSTSSSIGNLDGSTSSPYGAYDFGKAPYTDDVSGTLGDVATYYYANNLRPDLTAGLVTPDTACGSPGASPSLDCNKNLHMDTYAVSLVGQGLVWNVDTAATNDPFTTAPSWPATTAFSNRSPTGIDDLWHATLDGRGEMFAASTPQQIASKLQLVLNSIASRTSSASAIATNSTRLDTDTFIYQARFSTTDWTGSLRAFKVQSDGSVESTASWDAAQQLPVAASRNIATWVPSANSGAGGGMAFEWSDLDSTQQAALNNNPTSGTSDSLGSDRVTWLRGGSVASSDGFRSRASALGDIINSNPLYVQDANFDYNAAPYTVNSLDIGQGSYSSYFVNKLNRQGVIYVGANDGMLHAFNADTGAELFAFVPDTAIASLNKLTAANYAHQYYVDGTPTYGDAFLSGAWGTYLVGSMGAGGTGVFALNITNPTSNTESNASSWVLWEINNASSGFSDIGYTIPRASIALMANGQYAAIVSNGFDSATGKAALFIINLQTGALIRELTTTGSTTSPNGMAAATPVDTNNDRVTNYIYAGDLQGNLWKFDVSSTNPANWCISNDKGGCGATSTPLFKAVDSSGIAQPITVRPVVGLSQATSSTAPQYPQIYFGTGKYFEDSDNVVGSSPGVQTFYSIIDQGTGTISRSALLQQQILETSQVSLGTPPVSTTVRVTTDNTIGTKPGWYMDLLSSTSATAAGERVVSAPELDNGRIIFTTLIPNIDPCQFGGTSFLMELDAYSGSRLSSSPFDLNGDKLFNNLDYVSYTDSSGTTTQVAVSGQQSTVGIIQTPAIISASSLEYKYFSGSTGTIGSVKESLSSKTGRQSWVQLQ